MIHGWVVKLLIKLIKWIDLSYLYGMKKIYLVDVSSMFFRAFYAIRPLSSSKGVPVNAVYGFISMIIKLIREKNPEYVLFCYDRKEPSFRKDLYVDYKANRTEMPDDLQVQMPYLKQVADLFGIADIEAEGYEADDLIGTVAKLAEKENFQVYIVSGDKDFSQLVNENVFIYDTMKEFIYTKEAVKEKHGVYPEQFIDFLAITGDTSDHIPGIAGIGPKGAQKLIEEFKNLENLYEQIEKGNTGSLSAKNLEKITQAKDLAILSKKLVTIACDIPINKTIEDFRIKNFKTEELRAFLQDLNFKSFEKTLLGEGNEHINSVVSAVKSESKPSQTLVTEPNISTDKRNLIFTPWIKEIIQSRIKNEKFFMFLCDSQIFIIFENQHYSFGHLSEAQLDYKNIKWSGFDIKKIWTEIGLSYADALTAEIDWDLMLGSYTLKASDTSDLKDLVWKKLNIELAKDLSTNNYKTFVEAVDQLNRSVVAEVVEKKVKVIYEKIEKPMIPILYAMEKSGIQLDVGHLKKFSAELENQIKTLETDIHQIAGEKFNIASPKQLGVILFEKLGLEAVKKTKTGYSTDNEVLEKLNHPIAQHLMDYRELTKLKSTYVDALPELVDQSGRLHTHFNQALTTTGRLSSNNPNLQNIPIKTEKGQRVRQAFIASAHKKLLSLDYSQIELRVLAHISDDKALISAFKDDLDIHTATASEVFSVDLKNVTKEQRRVAKAVNFGIAYGQGAYGLAETLGISRTESKDIIDKYFKKFSGIKDYISSTIELAHERKFVETLFGRRRYLSELESTNAMVKKFGERAAINAPIQGTASDLMKMAMIDVYRYMHSEKTNREKFNLLLQVHDELVFEGEPRELDLHLPAIKNIMENVVRLKVPLKVNSAIGNNWDQAH